MAAGAAARGGGPRAGGAALLLCAWLVLTGCEGLGYYGQVVRGQLQILAARQSVHRLLSRADTPETLRARLHLVQSARVFAADLLALPVGDSYTSYVDLGRSHVVWNVYATPALSLSPREWCYPIAGCAVYRGYFARADAEAYAARLRAAGDDVHVGGVVAYSTLGWFDDPVLSSFDALRTDDLVGLVFHETAHRRVYVPGDSRFNEGYATFVEEQGLLQWHTQGRADEAGADAARRDDAIAKLRQERAVRASFLRFVLGYRDRLAALYAGPLPPADKLARKEALFEQMRREYGASSGASSGAIAGRYDRFFTEPLNNARLVTFSTYHDWVPAFAELYRRAGSWPEFHARARSLADDTTEARAAALDRLRAIAQESSR